MCVCVEWASTKDLKAMKALIKAGLNPRPSPLPTPLPTLPLPAAPTSTTCTGAVPVAPVSPPVSAGVINATETAAVTPTAAAVLSVSALEGSQPCMIEPTATATALDDTTAALPTAATVAPEGSSDTSLLPPVSTAVTSGECSDAVLVAPLDHSNDAAAITVAAAAAVVVAAVAVASSTSIL